MGRLLLTLAIVVSAAAGLAATGALVSSADDRQPRTPALVFPVGARAPDVELRNDTGAAFRFGSLAGRPAVLVFFRSAACPYCRAQLRTLIEHADSFERANVHLVGLSPDAAPALAELRRELGVPFRLVSDEDEWAVQALCGGVSHCHVVLDARGVVRWAAASESWSAARSPQDLLREALHGR